MLGHLHGHPEVLEIIFNRFPAKKIIRKGNAKTLLNLLLDRHLLQLVAVVPHGVHYVAEVLKLNKLISRQKLGRNDVECDKK